MAIAEEYRKDLAYLQDKSRKGTLQASNAIYKKLADKARNLPELKRALDQLNVSY